MNIEDLSAEQIADAYLKRAWSENDDPVDHGLRLVEMVGLLAGKDRAAVWKLLTTEFDSADSSDYPSIHKSAGKMISRFSQMAFALCPSRSAEFWTGVIDLVFARLWGGNMFTSNRKKAFQAHW